MGRRERKKREGVGKFERRKEGKEKRRSRRRKYKIVWELTANFTSTHHPPPSHTPTPLHPPHPHTGGINAKRTGGAPAKAGDGS